MRIVYFAWDEFGVPTLMKLVNSDHELLGVVSMPSKRIRSGSPRINPVEAEAEKFGLPVYDYEIIDSSEIAGKMRRLRADLGMVGVLGEELPDPLRHVFSAGCIGIHPSLLPKYRGPSPISWSILNRERKTGVTVYRITDRPYTGPVLVQRETMIRPGEIWTELHFRLARIACDAIDAALKTLEMDPHYAGAIQDESEASWAPDLEEKDGYLHFDEAAEGIALRCRAMWPRPGTLCKYVRENGEVEHVHIVRAFAERGVSQFSPGTITTEFKLATGEGLLQIQEVKPVKDSIKSWQEFIQERHVSPGERFESIPG
jgi:methionyl-tRNA formyltransferase